MSLYNKADRVRFFDERSIKPQSNYRTDFRRDLDRLIHSACFRRLQGKTQLYPGMESDFFRNRLTHSLEVAQIAKSIAAKINAEEPFLKKRAVDLDIVEFAGLAHDLGHPPFGHQGEHELNLLMKGQGGYEGNAQTFRLLTKIEKKGFEGDGSNLNGKDSRKGLNLCARTLASILKYDKAIEYDRSKEEDENCHPQKGYYDFDKDLIEKIKKSTGGYDSSQEYKTIECQIMDIADDIAYSTYDLEDGLKAGFYTLQDIVFLTPQLREAISSQISIKLSNGKLFEPTPTEVSILLQNLFRPFLFRDLSRAKKLTEDTVIPFLHKQYEIVREYADNGYARNFLTSYLVDTFIEGVKFKENKEYPAQSTVYLEDTTYLYVELLKKFTYISQVLSCRLKVAEFRGKEIVNEIFVTLIDHKKRGFELLPDDYRNSYETAGANKHRIVCDYVAGMTDRYAIEFYARLKSENAETIFKPL